MFFKFLLSVVYYVSTFVERVIGVQKYKKSVKNKQKSKKIATGDRKVGTV